MQLHRRSTRTQRVVMLCTRKTRKMGEQVKIYYICSNIFVSSLIIYNNFATYESGVTFSVLCHRYEGVRRLLSGIKVFRINIQNEQIRNVRFLLTACSNEGAINVTTEVLKIGMHHNISHLFTDYLKEII